MRKQYTGLPKTTEQPGIRDSRNWTPMLNVRVLYNHQMTPTLPAVVDSGSPFCLFRADVADYLHINLQGAPQSQLGGIIGGPKDVVFFRPVKLVIENNWTIDVYAGFMKKLGVAAILGRGGFFDRFYVSFDHSTSPPEFEIGKIDLSN
jgi:hypothetical protein